jgi:ABC-type transport system involved in multi-copper enzyme maturation permease subunit
MLIRQTIAVTRNTFREAVRDRVLYNLVAFAVIMIGSALLFGQISLGIHKIMVINLGLSSISIFGLLIAIFIGIGSVHKEIDKRSLYAVLSKPIRRWQFLLGKFAGLNLTLVVNTAIMTAGLWAALFYLTREFQAQDISIWAAIYFIILELTLVSALCLFFSCFTTPILAAIFTFLLYFVGSFSPDLKAFAEMSTSPLTRQLITGLYYVLPNFSNFQVSAWVSNGNSIALGMIISNSLYAVYYCSFLLMASVFIFSRKDLK